MLALLRLQAVVFVTLLLAVKKWSGKSSSAWNLGANWEPETTTASSDELEVQEGKPNIELNPTAGKAKQLVFNAGYAGTFSSTATAVLSLGTTTGTGTALKLVSSMTVSLNKATLFKLVSQSNVVEGITTAGKTMCNIEVGPGVAEPSKCSYRLEDALTLNSESSTGVTLVQGTLNTNGQTVTAARVNISGEATRTLTLGASSLVLVEWIALTSTGLTFTVGTSNIQVSAVFQGGGLTYATVTLAPGGTTSVLMEQNNTVATLAINSKGHAAGKGAQLKVGSVQTVTSAITSNGTGSELARLETSKSGEKAKLKIAAGKTLEVEHLAVQDIEVEGGGALIVNNGKDEGGNAGAITFATTTATASLAMIV